MAAYKTILKILPPAIQEKRVLPAQKTAVAKRDAVAIHANRKRLADRAGGIFERHILRRKIIGIDGRGRCLERANRCGAFDVRDTGVEIESKNRVGGII